MEEAGKNKQEVEKKNKITTFSVPMGLSELKENIKINDLNKLSREEIINKAFNLYTQGNILKASSYYQYCINQGFEDDRVYSNYALIKRELGKLKDAEKLYRNAIKINPDYFDNYLNLGTILIDTGKLEEAEKLIKFSLNLNPDSYRSYFLLSIILVSQNRLEDAKKSLVKAIEIEPENYKSHLALGGLYAKLGQIYKAELSTRKAIQIKPDIAEAYFNLGGILINLGKLKEAKESLLNAINIDVNYTKPYFVLSGLSNLDGNEIWRENLFSEGFLNNKNLKQKIDIYFARANLLHKEKRFDESAKNLKLANNIKLDLKPSKVDLHINKSRLLLIESKNLEVNKKVDKVMPENIFIVGMLRSGSTLLESILSMNENVKDLGEVNILMESFMEWKKLKLNNKKTSLNKIYIKKVNKLINQSFITTNKFLYNYQFTGVIASQITNAKIIHCFRHPLDNILSMYRANFVISSEFSSSLIDCAKVYLDQEDIMDNYKKKYRSKIYDLNYDLLVTNTKYEIKSLISWLGWQWNDSYLSPHLNTRSVSTASNVQVRSPINSKSVGGWKNYREMLQPAIEVLESNGKYNNSSLFKLKC